MIIEIPPNRARSSIVGASIWMVVITLLLFFLPAVNGLIGGFVGGYKVGGMGRALLASILPAIVVGLGLWFILTVFHAPVIGFLAGAALAMIVLLADVGIFVGAAIGGLVSPRRTLHVHLPE